MKKIMMAVITLAAGQVYAGGFALPDIQQIKTMEVPALAVPVQTGKSEANIKASADGTMLDNNNPAHADTWFMLSHGILNELGKDDAFITAGRIKIADLASFREDNSAIPLPETALATRLEPLFVNMLGAERRTPNSLADLAALLRNGRDTGKNVRWLADGINGIYVFTAGRASLKTQSKSPMSRGVAFSGGTKSAGDIYFGTVDNPGVCANLAGIRQCGNYDWDYYTHTCYGRGCDGVTPPAQTGQTIYFGTVDNPGVCANLSGIRQCSSYRWDYYAHTCYGDDCRQ